MVGTEGGYHGDGLTEGGRYEGVLVNSGTWARRYGVPYDNSRQTLMESGRSGRTRVEAP